MKRAPRPWWQRLWPAPPAPPELPDLRDAHRRLQLLLDHMPDGVIAFDTEGRVEWINPAARLIFQRGASSCVGRPIERLVPDLPAALDGAATVSPGEVPGQGPAAVPRLELDGLRRDGTRVPLEVALVVWRGEGARKAGMCVCRDLSESRRVEQLKREFVTMVSHELRTPLTSLRGSLALLTEESFAGLPHDARRLLRLAADNSERLVALVNDILDFEKLRAGAMRVDLDALDLHDAVGQVLVELEGMAKQAGVRLRLGPSLGDAPVLADPQRLAQVVGNLVSNAVKHSPPGGSVELEVTAHAERWRLTVRDSGEGVPPDLLPRLFQPFEQAGEARKRKPGTGLGLAISRALMEMMHGAIGVEPPQSGTGAAFWIELPAHGSRPSTFGEFVE